LNIFAIFTFGLFFQLVFASFADAGALLREITKQEVLNTTQLKLKFSELPAYRLENSGQRVDLFLDETEGDPALNGLPEDGKVVRILLGQHRKELMASFLLRSVPESVKVLTNVEAAQLILELSWSAERTPRRLAIASKLRGELRVQRDGTTLKLGAQTSCLEHWQTFFSDYKSPLNLPVPLTYTLSPLPRLLYQPLQGGALGDALLAGIELSHHERWNDALLVFQRIPVVSLQGVDREAFLVFYAESLVRVNQNAEAHRILEAFCKEYANSAILARARYLLGYLCAVLGRPYDAFFQLSLLNKEAEDKAYYIQIGSLLQSELELAVGRPEKSLEILNAQTFPAAVAHTRARRQADALAGLGRYGEALPKYRSLEEGTSSWGRIPFSLALLAETLYQENAYLESVARYTELLNQIDEAERISQVLFAQGRGLLRFGNVKEATIRLREVSSYWPETEGSHRARLLLLDQEILADQEGRRQQAVPLLYEIAGKTKSREVREEATFKRLLLNILLRAGLDSIQACEEFLKQFGQGRYGSDAEGLLSEILPQVIHELIAGEDYLEALVLVEKHRQRLVTGPTNQSFLLDLGAAFRQFGLLDKAANVYFYLLDAFKGQPAEESFFLPLVQVLGEQGDYRLILEYADRYLARYPVGRDLSGILLLKVEALHDQGRNAEAAKVLTSAGLPQSLELDLLAGKVFWELNQPVQSDLFFARALADSNVRQEYPDAAILLAESLFQLKKWGRALALYRELLSAEGFSDQARYRSAQILLIQGQKVEALKFFRVLAEEGKSPQWQKVARGALLSEQTKGF
jgi:tetratricopeptide (TPR) repeat protein